MLNNMHLVPPTLFLVYFILLVASGKLVSDLFKAHGLLCLVCADSVVPFSTETKQWEGLQDAVLFSWKA